VSFWHFTYVNVLEFSSVVASLEGFDVLFILVHFTSRNVVVQTGCENEVH